MPGLNEIEASSIDFSGNKSIIDRIYITRISSAVGNDHFHRAQVLTVGGDPISGDNTLATKQHWEHDHANNAGAILFGIVSQHLLTVSRPSRPNVLE